MASKQKQTPSKRSPTQLDSVYLLKIVLYLIVGTLWLRIQYGADGTQIPLPIGAVIGILFAAHDHFRIDRKVEYAILLVAMLVGFWTQAGVYLTW
jgi:hypothetical protein